VGVTAIILAGGRATRMQGEKPLRLLKGRTLLEHSLDLVAPLADEVLVASGARELETPTGCKPVKDAPEFAGQGPLAGILAGLEAAAHAHALVLACDLPNLPTALLKSLLQSLSPDCDCCWCEHSGHPEPLAAAMRTSPAREAVRKALAKGANKVVPCWKSMAHCVLGENELAVFAPLERAFANLNTLADLEREDTR
jgi:molybdopterin-guanine dinucleotide biosynthesis protein A